MSVEETLQVPSGSRSLDCYVARPEGRGRRAAVIVVHEIFGVDPHIRDVARRFAGEGYVAAAPNLFTGELQALMTPSNIALAMQAFAQAPPELRRDPSKLAEFAASQPPERRPILAAFGQVNSPAAQEGFARDLLAVARYLRSREDVDPARLGAVGFCFGGGMAGRLATVDPDLRASVIFYGQNPPLGDLARIRASVLGLYGADDPGITSTVPALADAMNSAGKSFRYHVYPGAKHAFFNDTRPSNYHAPSATDAWRRVLELFGQTLEDRPGP